MRTRGRRGAQRVAIIADCAAPSPLALRTSHSTSGAGDARRSASYVLSELHVSTLEYIGTSWRAQRDLSAATLAIRYGGYLSRLQSTRATYLHSAPCEASMNARYQKPAEGRSTHMLASRTCAPPRRPAASADKSCNERWLGGGRWMLDVGFWMSNGP